MTTSDRGIESGYQLIEIVGATDDIKIGGKLIHNGHIFKIKRIADLCPLDEDGIVVRVVRASEPASVSA